MSGEGDGGGSKWKGNAMSSGEGDGSGSRWDILVAVDVVFSSILLVLRHDQLRKDADSLQVMKLNDEKLAGGEYGDGGPWKLRIDVAVC
jgi:hypothetical protein